MISSSKFENNYKRLMTSILPCYDELGTYGKPQTLMDMATILVVMSLTNGRLDDTEVSDEINASRLKLTWMSMV